MTKYSVGQLQAIEDINVRIDALEAVMADLKSALRQCDVSQARVAVVPRPKIDEEVYPERVEPEAFEGKDAFERALFSLTDWYGDGEYSTKAVARTPGAIVLRTSDTNAEHIERLAGQANALKDQIRDRVPLLGKRNDRFELLHKHHHMLVTLQLTRHVTVLPPIPALQSLSFTWGVKTEIKKVSLEHTLKLISEYLYDPAPEGMTSEQWAWNVNKELSRVGSLPENVELRWRRVLVVRPMVNIRRLLSPAERDARRDKWEKEGKFDQPVTLREAHTPMILLNPENPIRLGTLGVYSAHERSQRQKRKGRKSADEPVSPLVPIYPMR